jgi:hypothetical protein
MKVLCGTQRLLCGLSGKEKANHKGHKEGTKITKKITMLKRRIIPCLDIKNGRTVKGINFLDIRDAGDPVELAKKYAADGADELSIS